MARDHISTRKRLPRPIRHKATPTIEYVSMSRLTPMREESVSTLRPAIQWSHNADYHRLYCHSSHIPRAGPPNTVTVPLSAGSTAMHEPGQSLSLPIYTFVPCPKKICLANKDARDINLPPQSSQWAGRSSSRVPNGQSICEKSL